MIDLKIINGINLPIIINITICIILFMGNMFFIFSISLKVFDKKIVKILFGFIPVYLLYMIIPQSIFQNYGSFITFIVGFLYCLLFNKQLTLYNLMKRYGILSLVIGIYQKLSGFIKLDAFGFGYYTFNSITSFLYQIDLFLVYILIYIGVKKYVELVRKVEHTFKFPFSFKMQSISENVEQGKEKLDLSDLNNRQRFIFWCMATSYQIFQLAAVLLIGIINNTFIELCIMLIIFWIGRPILGKSWHSDSLKWCSIITFSGFYILTKLVLPLDVSLLSCISLSGLFIYCLHRAGIYDEEHEKLLQEKAQIKNQKKSKTKIIFTEKQLSDIENSNKLSDRELKVFKLYYRREWNIEDIAAELDVSRRTIDTILKSIREKALH